MRDFKSSVSYKWYREVWNKDNREAIGDLMTDDVLAHGLGEIPLKGPDQFKKYFDLFRSDFDNVNIVVEDVVSQDDMEASLCRLTARYKQTGKRITMTGQSLVRIRDGRIAEGWNHFDFASLAQQLA